MCFEVLIILKKIFFSFTHFNVVKKTFMFYQMCLKFSQFFDFFTSCMNNADLKENQEAFFIATFF